MQLRNRREEPLLDPFFGQIPVGYPSSLHHLVAPTRNARTTQSRANSADQLDVGDVSADVLADTDVRKQRLDSPTSQASSHGRRDVPLAPGVAPATLRWHWAKPTGQLARSASSSASCRIAMRRILAATPETLTTTLPGLRLSQTESAPNGNDTPDPVELRAVMSTTTMMIGKRRKTVGGRTVTTVS